MSRKQAEAKASIPRLLKVSEVSELLGQTVHATRNLIQAGELPAINISMGRQPVYRIAEPDLARFLESRRTAAA
jgi:excisionase family DNA binding protein